MKDTETKRRGRPLTHGERLERVQLLITREQADRLNREANETGRSISMIVRGFIDSGIRASDKGKVRR